MKKIIFILLFLLADLSQVSAQYFLIDTLALNTAYRDLQMNPDTQKRQMAFFNAFPNSWNEYIGTYQYVDDHRHEGRNTKNASLKNLRNVKKTPSGYDLTMYNLTADQVGFLKNKMFLIEDSVYCAKVVNLAIGAKLDADEPTYLQSLEHVAMWKRTDAMMKVISQLTTADQMQYWQFFWSSIHRQKSIQTEYNKLYKLLSKKHPEEMKIMATAFKYFYGNTVFQSANHIDQRKYVDEKN